MTNYVKGQVLTKGGKHKMLRLNKSMAEIQILGYLRIRQDGKVLYFDPVEGNCIGASILRVCNLDLTYVLSKPGDLIDVRAEGRTHDFAAKESVIDKATGGNGCA